MYVCVVVVCEVSSTHSTCDFQQSLVLVLLEEIRGLEDPHPRSLCSAVSRPNGILVLSLRPLALTLPYSPGINATRMPQSSKGTYYQTEMPSRTCQIIFDSNFVQVIQLPTYTLFIPFVSAMSTTPVPQLTEEAGSTTEPVPADCDFDIRTTIMDNRSGYPPFKSRHQTWRAHSEIAFPSDASASTTGPGGSTESAGGASSSRSLCLGGKFYHAGTPGMM